MRVEAENPEHQALRAVRKDTGEVIPLVHWADTDTGQLGVWRSDGKGYPVDNPDNPDADVIIDVLTDVPFRIALWNDLETPLAETA